MKRNIKLYSLTHLQYPLSVFNGFYDTDGVKLINLVFMTLITIKIIQFQDFFALHSETFINTRIFYELQRANGSTTTKCHTYSLYLFSCIPTFTLSSNL